MSAVVLVERPREAKKAMERCLLMDAKMHVDIPVLVMFRILYSI